MARNPRFAVAGVALLALLVSMGPRCGGAGLLLATAPLGAAGALVQIQVDVPGRSITILGPAEADDASPVQADPDGILLTIGEEVTGGTGRKFLLLIDGNGEDPELIGEPISLGGQIFAEVGGQGPFAFRIHDLVSGVFKNRRHASLHGATAQVKEIGPFGLTSGSSGAAADQLYLLVTLPGPVTPRPALLVIDTATGTAQYVGDLLVDFGAGPEPISAPAPGELAAIYCDDSELLAAAVVDGTPTLLSVDPATAVATPIASTIADDLLADAVAPAGALGFDPSAASCASVLTGTGGNDVLVGTPGDDCIDGLAGNDHLMGRQGNDQLDGGPDDDDLNGNDGDDTLFGGGGDDRLDGNNGQDFLDGGPGEDVLKGGNDDDTLAGGPDDDLLDGGNGFDCAVLDGDLADFDFGADTNGDLLIVDTVGPGGTDTARKIECFEFDDQTVVPGPNDAPVDILLSNDMIDDGDPVGTLVGDLTTIDPDLVDGHAYALVPGAGDADNASFVIIGDQLFTNFVADFFTQDTYSIRIETTDLAGATFEKIFVITVKPPQAAVDDTATVTEDDPATAIPVLANDTNSFPTPISSVSQPNNGTVVITGGLPGTGLTYEPDPDYCNDGVPTDDFTYTLIPSGSVGTVRVTVTCVDDPPVAVDDVKTVTEDDPATTILVLGNDTDVDGGPKSVTSVTQPINGTVLITGGGSSVSYEPDPDYCNDGVPTDDFTYTLTPGGSVGTVRVTVTCVDDPPVAVDDVKTVTEDDPATTILVLGNDTDSDGGAISVTSVTQPPVGTVLITGGGSSVSYQPDPDFCNDGIPTDDFTYTLTPGGSVGTVRVTVTCVDDPPVAVDDVKTVTEDDPATTITVLTNDTDVDGGPKSVTSVTQPPGGTVLITGGGSSVSYEPDPDFCNDGIPTDDFTYTLTPGGSVGTVRVTVTCVDDPPVAVDDVKTVTENDPATTITVLTNDTDLDGGPISVTSVTQPTNGTVLITGGGSTVSYEPDPAYCNNGAPTDDFTYTLSPGGSVATVKVTVTCAQAAMDDTATVTEDIAATAINVLGNDTGTAGSPISGVTQPSNGTVLITGGGSGLTYQPDPDYCNDGVPTDDFTYTLSPSGSVGTVRVTVTCVNDPPTAAAGPYAVRSNVQINTPLASGLLALSADHPSEATTVSVSPASVGTFATTAFGSVTIAANGSFTYDPPPGFTGADDFSFTVDDSGIPGTATSAPATVTLNVAGPTVWFIDDSAAPGGDGTLAKPFDCIVGAGCFDAVAADDPGDSIFVAAGSYSSSLTLLSGQQLLGAGASASLATMVPGLTPLPANSLTPLPSTGGSDPVLTSGVDAVTVGTNNTVRGLTIGGTGLAALSGSVAGTLTVTELTVNGSGEGVDLSGSTGTMNFTGDVSLSTGASTAFSITGGGTVNVTTTNGPNDVTTTTGTAVEISGTTIGGSGVTFESIDSTSAGGNVAIILDNTGGGTFDVTGTGGTCAVGTATCTGGRIANKTGDAVTLNDTDGRVTLTSMLIEDIGSTGGGFDTRSQHDAIHGEDVLGGLTLDNVLIRRISDMCVNGALFAGGVLPTNWVGLDILNSTIEDCNRWHVAGTGDTSDEGAVRIVGLTGTVTVDNSTIQRGGELMDLFTAPSGTLDMTVTNSDFIDAFKEFTSGGTVAIGKFCIDVTVEGSSDANVTIGGPGTFPNNEFINCGTASVRVAKDTVPAGTSDIDVIVDNNQFRVTDQTSANGVFGNTPQGGVALRAGPGGIDTFDAIVSNNTFGVAVGPDDRIMSTTDEIANADGVEGNVALIFEEGASQARVNNNTFNGSINAPWFNRGDGNASAKVLYRDNTYRGRDDYCCDSGFTFTVPGIPYRTRVRNGGNMDITFRNDNFVFHDQFFFAQTETIELESPNIGGGGTLKVCLDNVTSGDGFEFDEDAGSISLYQGAVNNAATGPCGVEADGHAVSDCELEVADDGVRGGPAGHGQAGAPTAGLNPPHIDVDGGSITITGTACQEPSGGIF